MKQLNTEIIINASQEKVWNIFSDFEKYPEWNPLVKSLKGNPRPGEQIEITLALKDAKPQTFKPIVLKNEAQKEFRWKGKLFFKGLFDGEHYFIFKKVNDTQTKLIHGENFNGILVGLIMRMIGEKTEEGFNAMNRALKERAEADDAWLKV